MLIFNFIISLIFIIIAFFVLYLITKFLLYIFTKYEYKSYYISIASFLTMGIWSLGFILWYIILTYIFKLDIVQIIISIIIKEPYIPNNFLITILVTILACLIFQSMSLLTVNIDYTKLTGSTRFFLKNILNIRSKPSRHLVIKDEINHICIKTSILISIITFFVIIFSFFILLFIGIIASKSLI